MQGSARPLLRYSAGMPRAEMTTILGIRPSIQKVAKRGGQKPRRENGHANIDGQGDNKVIDAFTRLEKFHGGKRRQERLVPIGPKNRSQLRGCPLDSPLKELDRLGQLGLRAHHGIKLLPDPARHCSGPAGADLAHIDEVIPFPFAKVQGGDAGRVLHEADDRELSFLNGF
jgi:hypothetical protein